MGAIEKGLYKKINGKVTPTEFPYEVVKKITEKHLTKSQLGLMFPTKGTIAVGMANDISTPTISDNETGYWDVSVGFPNASEIPLPELDKRIGRFMDAMEKVYKDCSEYANDFLKKQEITGPDWENYF